MNIYKNLMFLHGHFVDPRDADDDAAPAAAAPAEVRAVRAAAAPVSRRVQAGRPSWLAWFTLWPGESSKVKVDCDARGCA